MHGAELSDELLARFLDMIYRLAGIRIPDTKKVMVTNRLRRRLRATKLASFEEYYRLLTSLAGNAEIPFFLNEITTNETFFYRDVHHFDWLSQEFLPTIAEEGRLGKRPRKLRIWSAAASSGEELYSICLRFMPLRQRFTGWTIHLVGTDISNAALDLARKGTYDERALRLVSPAERTRYFDFQPAADRWTIKDEIRALPRWTSHNLMRPLNEEPFDCIFIKNVLIYFDTQSKQTVTRHLLNALAPGGSLVVGPTEGIHNMLGTLRKTNSWLYQRSNP